MLILVLRARSAATLPRLATTHTALTLAAAVSLVSARDLLRSVLRTLEICETTSLVVDIKDLLRTLLVERNDALASRGLGSLLEVRVQCVPHAIAALGDGVFLVDALGLLSGLVLLVELL